MAAVRGINGGGRGYGNGGGALGLYRKMSNAVRDWLQKEYIRIPSTRSHPYPPLAPEQFLRDAQAGHAKLGGDPEFTKTEVILAHHVGKVAPADDESVNIDRIRKKRRTW